MPILNDVLWQKFVSKNQDPYGGCCVKVAKEVMRLLDAESIDWSKEREAHRLVCAADDNIKTGGITGFMAGCVASMVAQCHSEGAKFNANWNGDVQVSGEGAAATAA